MSRRLRQLALYYSGKRDRFPIDSFSALLWTGTCQFHISLRRRPIWEMVTTSKWMPLDLINGWSKSYLGDTLTFPLSRRPLWALCKYTNTQFLMHQSFKRTKWFSLYFIFLYEWVPQEGLGWPSYIRDEFLKPKISLVNLIWDIAPCVNEVNHHTLVSWGKSPNVNWEKSPNVSWGKSQIPVEGKCALYWMRSMMIFPREANLGLLLMRVSDVGNISLLF